MSPWDMTLLCLARRAKNPRIQNPRIPESRVPYQPAGKAKQGHGAWRHDLFPLCPCTVPPALIKYNKIMKLHGPGGREPRRRGSLAARETRVMAGAAVTSSRFPVLQPVTVEREEVMPASGMTLLHLGAVPAHRERTGARAPVLDFSARSAKADLDLESISLASYLAASGPLQRPFGSILVN